MAFAGETIPISNQVPADGSIRRLNQNDARWKFLIENRSTGGQNVFWSSKTFSPTDANPAAVKIVAGGNFFDDAPGVHCGEVHVGVDGAGAVYAITEWS